MRTPLYGREPFFVLLSIYMDASGGDDLNYA